MAKINNKLCACICTYKRSKLLERIICDILGQTVQPDVLFIVDGNACSSDVLQMLKRLSLPATLDVVYTPSNHGNLAFQRYLGWKAAKTSDCGILLYLDDDLHIEQSDALEKTIAPLFWRDQRIVGVTGNIIMGDFVSRLGDENALSDRVHTNSSRTSHLASCFGAAKKVPPGGLSPSGHRCVPIYQGNAYEPIQWLRGGVMALRMDAITQDCFSTDLFALTHIGCGLGEDTILSRRLVCQGKLILAFNAHYLHPNDDTPKSYPIKPFRFGYATAYSRRLINDNYRGLAPSHLSDRIALVKSYLGTSLFNWSRAIIAPRLYRFAYAWGYTKGAFRGLVQKPTAKALTPHINWWKDADAALSNLVDIKPKQ